MVLRIGHINRPVTVRNGMRGIAGVGIECFSGVGLRRVKGKFAVFAKIQAACLRFTGRPGIKSRPDVAACLEEQRFFKWQRAFLLQPVSEPRRLDLLPEVSAGITAERDRAKRTPWPVPPAPVIPRPNGEI